MLTYVNLLFFKLYCDREVVSILSELQFFFSRVCECNKEAATCFKILNLV